MPMNIMTVMVMPTMRPVDPDLPSMEMLMLCVPQKRSLNATGFSSSSRFENLAVK